MIFIDFMEFIHFKQLLLILEVALENSFVEI